MYIIKQKHLFENALPKKMVLNKIHCIITRVTPILIDIDLIFMNYIPNDQVHRIDDVP